jgi:hypothetical protein
MKQYEYRYSQDGIVSYSSPSLEEWESEERFLHKWYRSADWIRYGRWSFGFTLYKFYRVLPEDKKSWFRREWKGFWIFGTYIPGLKISICGSLMRLDPRLKVYPKKKYRDEVSEHTWRCEGVCLCNREATCAVCGEGTGYLPRRWLEYGVWWEADFCKEHEPLDIMCDI